MSTKPEAQESVEEPEESLAADSSGLPAAKKRNDLLRRPPSNMVEEVLAMFAHSGPMRDPLLEEIGPEQINRTLEIRAKQEEHTHQIRIIQQKSYDTFVSKSFVLLRFLALVVCGLCWLFLHYGKTD